jgi:hypothetical protein
VHANAADDPECDGAGPAAVSSISGRLSRQPPPETRATALTFKTVAARLVSPLWVVLEDNVLVIQCRHQFCCYGYYYEW